MRHWWRQLAALSLSRFTEMRRDRNTLGWNLIFPLFLIAVFVYAFDSERPRFTVVAPQQFDMVTGAWYEFLYNRLIHVQYQDDLAAAKPLLARHQIDMIVDPLANAYWVNQSSANGYLLEKVLLQIQGPTQHLSRYQLDGEPIRYVDWVFPGILGANLMFSALWGVGYAIVRYRRNGVLLRLQASGVTPVQYLIAQLASRLLLMLLMVSTLFTGLLWVFEFPIIGSYWSLLILYVVAALAMLSLGVLLSSVTRAEELAGGLVNLITWPLMLFSEVWFSLQSAPQWAQSAAQFSPLWHFVTAARSVMYDGASLLQIGDHLLVLIAFAVLFIGLGSRFFRWR